MNEAENADRAGIPAAAVESAAAVLVIAAGRFDSNAFKDAYAVFIAVKALGDHAAGIASDSTLEEALADHANAHDHADYGDHEEATGA